MVMRETTLDLPCSRSNTRNDLSTSCYILYFFISTVFVSKRRQENKKTRRFSYQFEVEFVLSAVP